MTPRYTVNRSPSDGHLPADWATASKRGTLRLTALVAGLFFAVVMLFVGVGWA